MSFSRKFYLPRAFAAAAAAAAAARTSFAAGVDAVAFVVVVSGDPFSLAVRTSWPELGVIVADWAMSTTAVVAAIAD